ncbi:hypothetical protein BGW36DRAFT_364078 [Talaromyces proteolyticus]|uniref:Uncharacterized protein n=1 Tax=Talaromyces proteolyticus TaxID=1131652 RepID=A0AAD4PS54_9EURO|nr:uncharacterized protein BGW36DRAFT_364078 [Talaromyces proteolyticus]KAH8690502.1 hypothetical protein BGW36DRAFT_364078 [Talaromyces proteolyticus]
MALLDGPKGYNQRLVGNGLYLDGVYVERCDPLEAGLFALVVPVPTVLTPSQHQPVEPLDEDLPYIPDFLRGSSTARAVVATRCRFGWPRLSVDFLCLYVDADDTTGLENSIASLIELLIIKEAKLCHTVDDSSEALKLLAPTGVSDLALSDDLELSERVYSIRKNPIPRIVQQHGHVYHGQSISLMGEKIEGLGWEPKIHALTAYHVVPDKKANEQRVITPGGLDILSQLQAVVKPHPRSHEDIEVLLKRWNEGCGYVKYGHDGITQEVWRSDFALIHLDDHWLGENGQWYDRDELSGLHTRTEQSYFPGTRGIVGSIDPQTGDIVYKDGAATCCTAGRIGLSEAVSFERGTANIATDKTAPDVCPSQVSYAPST